MKPVKKSARERLVDPLELPTVGKAARAKLLRLLRAHERDRDRALANRAYLHAYEVERFDVQTCERIRAAILKRSAAPKAHGTRGKRGAK